MIIEEEILQGNFIFSFINSEEVPVSLIYSSLQLEKWKKIKKGEQDEISYWIIL